MPNHAAKKASKSKKRQSSDEDSVETTRSKLRSEIEQLKSELSDTEKQRLVDKKNFEHSIAICRAQKQESDERKVECEDLLQTWKSKIESMRREKCKSEKEIESLGKKMALWHEHGVQYSEELKKAQQALVDTELEYQQCKNKHEQKDREVEIQLETLKNKITMQEARLVATNDVKAKLKEKENALAASQTVNDQLERCKLEHEEDSDLESCLILCPASARNRGMPGGFFATAHSTPDRALAPSSRTCEW